MKTPRDPAAPGIRGLAAMTMTALGLAALLGACSSAAATSRTSPAAAARTACRQVTAALSDGPDPDADPVGYAEAQVLPLGQIRTSDSQLRAAVTRLARAYQAFYASNGTSGGAKAAVTSASKRIDAFCPGATS
jgi:predicted Zn-dependent protease